MRIANWKARQFVTEKKVFKGNNLFSEQLKNGYAVYSYGTHFPLYVYSGITQNWYRNVSKYSRTTSKHSSQTYPGKVWKELNLQEMKELVSELS